MYDPVSFNTYGTSFTYIRKRSDLEIDPCGTPQFISPTSEKAFSSVPKNILFERLKSIHSIFCKSTVRSNVSKAFLRMVCLFKYV